MQKPRISNFVIYFVAGGIILLGIMVIAFVILYSSLSKPSQESRSAARVQPWSAGCEAIHTVLEAPRTMLIRDEIFVTLSLTGGAKPFKVGEVIKVEGISTPESTSWIHFLQINRIMADGSIEFKLGVDTTRGYPDSYAEVRPLIASYEIPEDGNYNFRSDLIFFEFRNANEGTFNRAWCEHVAPK